jgi:hypothetical protein
MVGDSQSPDRAIPTERQIQRAILAMARTCFPDVLIHHSPGGAHLAGSATARFKQMGALKGDGMRPGFPDLICVWKGGVAFMEVKRAKLSKVSPEQEQMLSLIRGMGHPVAIIKSVDDAHTFLKVSGAPCRAELSPKSSREAA